MTHANAEYGKLVSRLARVRRAWKRTMALSGLVVVLSEVAGLVAVAVLVDFLFALHVTGRSILLAGVGAAAVILLARHVVMPIFRRIGEPQLALYLEERNPQFEGSLIAAVEFGPTRGLEPAQARIIDAIVQEAVLRVDRFDLRKAVDLRRFRKYGALAVLLLAAYAVSVLVLPDSVGKHVARVVTPWRPTREELADRQKRQEAALPVSFALSRGDTSLLRGSSFDLEATLSRRCPDPVCFHFRPFDPKDDRGAWKLLPMKEIEKLNGYQLVLPDVNEELEFYVASGTHKSSVHRLSVFDPLVVQGAQITTRLPAYLKLPDRVDQAPAPDVAALVGSAVNIRLSTNRPLARGEITWADGKTQPMTIDAEHKDQISINFDVKSDTTFQYKILDISGQEVQSPGPATVRALLDQPPTINLRQPEGTVTTHPLGEIAFVAEVSDDYGIAGADLVYSRGTDPAAISLRIPLKLDGPNAVGALMLETLSPAVQPGDMFTCHVECRDQKGQTAVTDLVLVLITPFDSWSCWDAPEDHAGVKEIHDLEPVLKAAWRLHTQKPAMAPVEFNRQAEELAATMVDPKTRKFLEYVDLKLVPPGEKMEHAKRAIKLIEEGHGQLKEHDTGKAVGSFRAALAEMAAAGLNDIVPVRPPASSAADAVASRMEDLKVKVEPNTPAPAPKPPEPQKPEKEDAANEAEKLQKQQEQIANKLKQAQPKGGEEARKEEKAAAEKAKAQAPEQKNLAEKARDVAQKMKEKGEAKSKDAAEKVAGASRTMHEAAKHMEQGEHEKAKQKAEEAAKQLANAVAELKADSQDELGKALDHAEEAAQRLVRQQKEQRQKAEKVAAELPAGKKPDAKQDKEMKVQTREQADLNQKIEEFARHMEKLDKMAKDGKAKEDTAKQIAEAQLQMKRNRVQQKAANAAVEMAAAHPDNAAEEQKKAEKGLEKVAEAIRAANDARAAGHEAELKRARNEAERVKNAIAQTQPAQKKEAAEKAVADAQRLARHLKQREFIKNDPQFAQDSKKLEEAAADPARLQKTVEEPKAKESEFAGVVARLHNKLEAEYQATLAAKSLFASQREECPPQYRQLVNRYFEALSTRK